MDLKPVAPFPAAVKVDLSVDVVRGILAGGDQL
jgi:hypothetical protein